MSGFEIDYVEKGVLTSYEDETRSEPYAMGSTIMLRDTDFYHRFIFYGFESYSFDKSNIRKVKKFIKKKIEKPGNVPLGLDPHRPPANFENVNGNLICSYCSGRANGRATVHLYKLEIYKRPPPGAKDLKVIISTEFVYKIHWSLICDQCGQKVVIETPSR